MCALCGILGVDDHWSDPVARPGVYAPHTAPHARRLQAARRLKIINAVLAARRLSLRHWQGTSHVLSSATGKSKIVESLAHLWPEAEAMASAPFDPLDPALLERLEQDP